MSVVKEDGVQGTRLCIYEVELLIFKDKLFLGLRVFIGHTLGNGWYNGF